MEFQFQRFGNLIQARMFEFFIRIYFQKQEKNRNE